VSRNTMNINITGRFMIAGFFDITVKNNKY
jgi:hypothetical protein